MYDNQFIGFIFNHWGSVTVGDQPTFIQIKALFVLQPNITLSCSAYEVNFGAHTLTSWLQPVSGIQEITHNVYTAMYSALCFLSERINDMAL